MASKRLLILKGPSGAGKTATVTALANAMNLDISEWKNPIDSNFSSEGYVSMSAQFEDFLGRSGKFGSLEFVDNGSREVLKPPASHTQSEITRKKVVVLEEFPSIFTSTSIALKAFRSSILSYLAVSTFSNSLILAKQDSVQKSSPVIMIITETSLSSEITSNDSFSAHRLLGPDILNHRAVSVIEFNPVASTYLAKALDLVIKKEARQSGRRRIPGPAVLKQLGENGDIRSAIGSLEFLCLKGNDGDDWGSSVDIKAKKGSNNSTALTEIEKKSLEMITRREAALGIFHAVGKVVYNKRDEIRIAIPAPDSPDQLPGRLQHTSMVSQVSPDQLINETGTDTRTFIAALHENYIMSCEGVSFTESFNGSIDALSDSDLLSSNQGQGSRFGRGLYQGGGASDSMRQDEICFHIAVRGILFALPYPVKRRAFPSGFIGKNGGKRDAFKMFYPTSLRLSKKQEEVEFLVDQWASQRGIGPPLQGLPTAKSTFATPAPNGDTSWERKSSAYHNTYQASDLYPEEINTVPTGMKSPQIELILETLPYVTQIKRCSPEGSKIEQLEKVTRFHGITAPTDDISEDEDMYISLESAIGQPQVISKSVLGIDSKKKGTQQEPQNLSLSHLAQTGTEKLWLSDDDIED